MSAPQPGPCPACERPVGRAPRVCPYCGEALPLPPLARAVRRLAPLLLIVTPLAAAGALAAAPPAAVAALFARLRLLAATPWGSLGVALVVALALPSPIPPATPGAPPSRALRALLGAWGTHLALALSSLAAAAAAQLDAPAPARLAWLLLLGLHFLLPARAGFNWRAPAAGLLLVLLLRLI